jgi:hypothetical protein
MIELSATEKNSLIVIKRSAIVFVYGGKNMTIREYLFKNRIPAAKMARDLGVNANYLRVISRDGARPGFELATKIELYTGGEVTLKELRNGK